MRRRWTIFHADNLIKFKLRFIGWFHLKFPGKYCWADCVAWAYSPVRFNPFIVDRSKPCEIESNDHSTGMCYCGGWKNGKCWDLMSEEEKKEWMHNNGTNETIDDLPF